MKILNKLTLNNLKLNKKRTLVTIIGIILSTALICAIAGMFTTLQNSMIKISAKSSGYFHVAYLDLDKKQLNYIENNREVKSYYETSTLGYAKIDNSNEYKPYLYILEYDDKALEDGMITLIEGNIPKKDNEIVIPEHIYNYGFSKKIGDKITLDIGKRVSSDGEVLNQHNPAYEYDEKKDDYVVRDENIIDTKTKEYTIVGIMKRPTYNIEDYEAPGYFSITYNNKIDSDKTNIYVRYKKPSNAYKEFCNTTGANEKEIENCLNYKNFESDIDYIYNSEILRWEGSVRNSDTQRVIYILASIVIGIVIISSVFVIRNSFTISVTERFKQMGMLSSIGATSKQIKRSVIFEGLILGVVAVPLGIILGVIADYVLVKIVNHIIEVNHLAATAEKMLYLKLSFFPILVSILLSFITIFLSTLLPARRASRISPIDAIRSNDDVKVKSKKLKVSKLTKKLFGIGGVIATKNLKRSRKKYRTTVISIVVSIVVFISLSSLINYIFISAVDDYYSGENWNVEIGVSDIKKVEYDENGGRIDNIPDWFLYNEFIKIAESNIDGIEDYAIARRIGVSIPMKYTTKAYKRYLYKYYDPDNSSEGEKEYYEEYLKKDRYSINISVVNDSEYKRLTKGLNLSKEEIENGLIFHDTVSYENYKGDKFKDKLTTLKVGDTINVQVENEDKKVFEIELPIIGIANTKDSLLENVEVSDDMYVSQAFLDKHPEFKEYLNEPWQLHLNCTNTDKLHEYIDELNKNNEYVTFSMNDLIETQKTIKAVVLIISIFLYGFITVITLIGVTNIFNVITTNMNLRRKEFAMLKAIGMTDKEFKKMISLESLLYGFKALVIGLIIGIFLSTRIFDLIMSIENVHSVKYQLPWKSILISIIFVFLIVYMTMRYSFSKINKQNIIETIRNDNI